MLISTEAAIEWQLPTGNMTYWKWQITEAEYEFAD